MWYPPLDILNEFNLFKGKDLLLSYDENSVFYYDLSQDYTNSLTLFD